MLKYQCDSMCLFCEKEIENFEHLFKRPDRFLCSFDTQHIPFGIVSESTDVASEKCLI